MRIFGMGRTTKRIPAFSQCLFSPLHYLRLMKKFFPSLNLHWISNYPSTASRWAARRGWSPSLHLRNTVNTNNSVSTDLESSKHVFLPYRSTRVRGGSAGAGSLVSNMACGLDPSATHVTGSQTREGAVWTTNLAEHLPVISINRPVLVSCPTCLIDGRGTGERILPNRHYCARMKRI
jgi:hypothetical protein